MWRCRHFTAVIVTSINLTLPTLSQVELWCGRQGCEARWNEGAPRHRWKYSFFSITQLVVFLFCSHFFFLHTFRVVPCRYTIYHLAFCNIYQVFSVHTTSYYDATLFYSPFRLQPATCNNVLEFFLRFKKYIFLLLF